MKAFGIVGWSGAGKTTVLEGIIPRLVAQGVRVSLIKHTHHDVDIDRPGKDSYRLREAGCGEVMLLSGKRWALMHELRGAPEPDLAAQLAILSQCDVVLVEGYKEADIPKLEVHRPALGKPLIYPDAQGRIVAVASSEALAIKVPCLPLHDHAAIARFIMENCL
jgi:molybdopterin-guanine dinucleotide biosynthesis adapter protein